MKRFVWAATAMLLASPAVAETTVLHAGRLLAVPGAPVAERQSVIIRDGKIAGVQAGFVDPKTIDPAATLVDLSDRFVMPGMMDLHVHLTMRLSEPKPTRVFRQVTQSQGAVALQAAASARQVLMNGFTTVRDAGGAAGVIFPLRDAINQGTFSGPRILAAGPMLSRTGGHGDGHLLRPEFRELPGIGDLGKGCSGPAACRAGVRERVADGADLIKISVSGSASDDTGNETAEPDMMDDELEAIVATARSLGRRVAAHVTSAKGIAAAVRAGVNTIEHGSFASKETLELMKQKGAILVPTAYVVTFLDKPQIQAGLKPAEWAALSLALKRARTLPGEAYRAGVRIAMGTDAGGDLDANRAMELQLYVESGMPAAEALKTATINAADALGLGDRLGQIKPGFEADLIAVTGDPLQAIPALFSIDFVMKSGRIYKQNGQERTGL